jgi:hypothetical protein
MDFNQTVNEWHSCTAYGASILDDSLLREWTNLFPKVFSFHSPKFESNYLLLNT